MNQLPVSAALLADLEQVHQVIMERAQSRSIVIQVAGRHILATGGKRIRAALALLVAQLGEYELSRVIHSAAAVELIHAASLVHDDLVDEADRRRGTVTIHNHWNSNVALMVGDYLFALAAAEMSLAPDPRIIAYFSRGVMTICEGELAPVTVVTPLDEALEQYRYKIGCKTAALFEAACKAGAVCGGLNQAQVDHLGKFGYELGMAFQIVDDILDYNGQAQELGKPVGSDLRAGTITLPLIYAVDAGASPLLIDIASTHPGDEAQISRAITEICQRGVEPARAEAYQHADQAMKLLAAFPENTVRYALEGITRYAVSRIH